MMLMLQTHSGSACCPSEFRHASVHHSVHAYCLRSQCGFILLSAVLHSLLSALFLYSGKRPREILILKKSWG